jgi:hypothetical protein
MTTPIKTGLGSTNVGIKDYLGTSSSLPTLKVGKVFGVVSTNNSPTAKQFSRAGGYGGIGTVFFLDYNTSKYTIGSNADTFLDTCDTAKPLFPNISLYPLLEELVYIIELPSPADKVTHHSPQKYYITSINLFNDPQSNSQPALATQKLGKTFKDNPNVRNLLNFEGDHIIQGRKGNSIRFGSTVKFASDSNEWSSLGTDGDPIIIISNGHNYKKDDNFYIEKIDEEASSIYLTSTQNIPFKVNVKDPINPLTKPLVNFYMGKSQVIINADRVILNSKKDDIMLFASSNIELSTNYTINLNANEHIHLNIKEENPTLTTTATIKPKIFLGTKFTNEIPTEPLMLGRQTAYYLKDLLGAIDIFATKLSPAGSSSQGSPIADIQTAADELYTRIHSDTDNLYDRIEKLLSKSTFTI